MKLFVFRSTHFRLTAPKVESRNFAVMVTSTTAVMIDNQVYTYKEQHVCMSLQAVTFELFELHV